MSGEFGEKLEKFVMEDHWRAVERKPYPMFKGVWEEYSVLPVTHTYDFEKEIDKHLEIPLLGGGHVKLGRAEGEKQQISVNVKFPTARGEMNADSFIVTETLKRDPYPFWIFYDDDSQNERMKFLARMKPEKDIDWEHIRPNTDEYKIAQALCRYKAFELPQEM